MNTYDDVVESLALKLGLDDPSKLRLTPHNCNFQQPKPHPIRYRGAERLLDMLVDRNQVICLNCALMVELLVYSLFYQDV